MTSIIKSLTREKQGQLSFLIETPGGHQYRFEMTDDVAADFATRLLDGVAGRGELPLRAEILRLRREMQQIATTQQEIAKKLARHEQLAVTTSVTINPSADLAKAIAAAGEFDRMLGSEAIFAC